MGEATTGLHECAQSQQREAVFVGRVWVGQLCLPRAPGRAKWHARDSGTSRHATGARHRVFELRTLGGM